MKIKEPSAADIFLYCIKHKVNQYTARDILRRRLFVDKLVEIFSNEWEE